MPAISPEQLHGQLREMVELLAAPASVQIRWLDVERFPVDELMQQFTDAVPAWFGRLRDSGLLPGEQSASLQRLRDQLEEMANHGPENLWEDDGLLSASEWADVRAQAAATLHLMS